MTDTLKSSCPCSSHPSGQNYDGAPKSALQNKDLHDELVFLTTLLEDQTEHNGSARKLCARHRHTQSLVRTEPVRLELLRSKGVSRKHSISKCKSIKSDNQNRLLEVSSCGIENDSTAKHLDSSSLVPFSLTSSHSTKNISTPHNPTYSSFAFVNHNPFLSNSNAPCNVSSQNEDSLEALGDISDDGTPAWWDT